MLRTEMDIADVTDFPRHANIRRMLMENRRALLDEIQGRVREVRQDGSTTRHHSAQHVEAFEADPEDDLAFALIQLKAELLARVDAAVRRLDEGSYGYCVDCGDAIASSRLRAMPFAVRCRDCEEKREQEQHVVRDRPHRVSSEGGLRH